MKEELEKIERKLPDNKKDLRNFIQVLEEEKEKLPPELFKKIASGMDCSVDYVRRLLMTNIDMLILRAEVKLGKLEKLKD